MVEVVITFIAGIVSFISPCVLPLVPAYIGYMGGRVTNTVAAQVTVSGNTGAIHSTQARFSTFMHGLAFVSGFTFIFVMLGVLGTALISLGGTIAVTGVLSRLGGLLIIFFGVHFMGAIPPFFVYLRKTPVIMNSLITSIIAALILSAMLVWGFTGTLTPWNPGIRGPEPWMNSAAVISVLGILGLMAAGGAFTRPGSFWPKALNTVERTLYTDTRRQMVATGNQGLAGSAFLGIVFAAGWTPCIGPTLGTAMTLAVSSGADVARGGILLAAFSMGLGIPFLLTALMLDSAQGVLRRLQKRMRLIELVSGAFLIFIGVTIATGRLQTWSQQLSRDFADVSYRIEQCVVGFFENDIYFGQIRECVRDIDAFDRLKEHNRSLASDAALVPGIQALAGSAAPSVGLRVGNLAPDFSTVMIDGETVRLSDFRGRPVMVNFWYTDCAPCRVEMPEFEDAYRTYADVGLVILAVNREESAEQIRAFRDEIGATFPMLLDENGDIQVLYNVLGYPSTYVLDANGVIVVRNFGVMNGAQIRSAIALAQGS